MEPDVERELDRLDKRVMAVEAVPLKIAALETENSGLKEDIARIERSVDQVHNRLSTLRKEIEERDKADQQRREADRNAAAQERTVERRWMIGTVLTAAGLVIAALAILLPLIVGPT